MGVEVDALEAGLDPKRLQYLTTHLHNFVDNDLMSCTHVQIARAGKIAFEDIYGWQDVERQIPIAPDSIFRIYSMTKPITSIALMQLFEQGHFLLREPISRWLPEFADQQVYVSGDIDNLETRPATRRISVHDLLTHMCGLSYDFHYGTPLSRIYRKRGFNWGPRRSWDLATTCEVLAELPLLFDPGTEWNYSMATDVAGRLVEVISGQPLNEYLAKNIFEPLGMVDTGFWVTEEKAHRLTSNYLAKPGSKKIQLLDDAGDSPYLAPPKALLGGAGLVSTVADYHRFTQMLQAGGTLDGQRIIGRSTLAFMTLNHLPDNQDLATCGQPGTFTEVNYRGMGFGLGMSVVIDPARTQTPCSLGEIAWGGAASTTFWVDTVEDVSLIFMTQLMPSDTHPIRTQLKALLYQALL